MGDRFCSGCEFMSFVQLKPRRVKKARPMKHPKVATELFKHKCGLFLCPTSCIFRPTLVLDLAEFSTWALLVPARLVDWLLANGTTDGRGLFDQATWLKAERPYGVMSVLSLWKSRPPTSTCQDHFLQPLHHCCCGCENFKRKLNWHHATWPLHWRSEAYLFQITTVSLARNINAVRFTWDGSKVRTPDYCNTLRTAQLFRLNLRFVSWFVSSKEHLF